MRKGLTPGAERGAPQAPTRTNPSPPPISTPAPAAAEPARGEPTAQAGDDRATRVEQAEGLLDSMQARTQGQVPKPRTAPIRDVSVRPTQVDTLGDRIDRLGATDRSLETQFRRLAGRAGSPLELSMLASRLELERQLRRPPTSSEMTTFISTPASLGPLFSPAVEGPPPQEPR